MLSRRKQYHNPVITLMVFQVVMILAVAQSNIAFIGQQQLLNTVLIDHVSAIVRRGGSAACLMDSFQLCAVGTISIGNRTTVTERDHITDGQTSSGCRSGNVSVERK